MLVTFRGNNRIRLVMWSDSPTIWKRGEICRRVSSNFARRLLRSRDGAIICQSDSDFAAGLVSILPPARRGRAALKENNNFSFQRAPSPDGLRNSWLFINLPDSSGRRRNAPRAVPLIVLAQTHAIPKLDWHAVYVRLPKPPAKNDRPTICRKLENASPE